MPDVVGQQIIASFPLSPHRRSPSGLRTTRVEHLQTTSHFSSRRQVGMRPQHLVVMSNNLPLMKEDRLFQRPGSSPSQRKSIATFVRWGAGENAVQSTVLSWLKIELCRSMQVWFALNIWAAT